MPVVSSVPQAEKRVAFTFDDGPHATFTRPILEALAAHGARATFFVRGAALDETTVQIVRETLAAVTRSVTTRTDTSTLTTSTTPRLHGRSRSHTTNWQ